MRGAEPPPSLPVVLNFEEAANQIYLNRLKGTMRIVVENVSIARQTNPHLVGMTLPQDVADVGLGKTLVLFVAVEGLAVEADEIVKSKPQMAGGILGNAPTSVGPLRRRRLLVVLQVERDQVVESRAVIISQGTHTTTPYTALPVFIEKCHATA